MLTREAYTSKVSRQLADNGEKKCISRKTEHIGMAAFKGAECSSNPINQKISNTR